ncbi:MAG TPA: AbrB/MazE/SpoVT family DNA-binding domain-containing protein [Candidatus Faecimonas gallistercoris]|nr:AbrB/MazE/SpoVT family DNA-binding domain-containing protein [Candidatus Faecimonas gallistercoris]
MEAKIQKWGNSDGIRIPSSILKSLNIKTNDIINIEQQDDKIIISVPKKKKISLEDRFKEYHGKNLAKEFSWDENVGREIW